MVCPRCDSNNVKVLTKAPVDDAWEVYICEVCYYSWRSTEADDLLDPAKYDKRFKIDPAKISDLIQIPPIPDCLEKQENNL